MSFVRTLSNLSSSIEEKGEKFFHKRISIKNPSTLFRKRSKSSDDSTSTAPPTTAATTNTTTSNHHPRLSKSGTNSPPCGPKVLLSRRNLEEFFNPDYEAHAHSTASEDDHPGKICISTWAQQLPPVSSNCVPPSTSHSQRARRDSRPNLEHRYTTCGHPGCHLRDDTSDTNVAVN